MSSEEVTKKRIFVVEDELMIRMLLEDMLDDLGYAVAAVAGRVDEAIALAKSTDFDVAILDVNLNGHPVSPVVEVLDGRGLPYIFATGYGEKGLPEAHRGRPTLQKPFQQETLGRALVNLIGSNAAI